MPPPDEEGPHNVFLPSIHIPSQGQMFLLDRFFDGTFFTYGIEVMSFADRDQEDRIDPMIYVFPRWLPPQPHAAN